MKEIAFRIREQGVEPIGGLKIDMTQKQAAGFAKKHFGRVFVLSGISWSDGVAEVALSPGSDVIWIEDKTEKTTNAPQLQLTIHAKETHATNIR